MNPFVAALQGDAVRSCYRPDSMQDVVGLDLIWARRPQPRGSRRRLSSTQDAVPPARQRMGPRTDKEREANDGHDGTWVAHPGLVQIALDAFNVVMPQPNQIHRKREDVEIIADDLLRFEPEKPITENGLRTNINIGIQYLGSWLAGSGCVPIFNLMEDAATAEISRSQIWQWINSPKGILDDGREVDIELFRKILAEELPNVRKIVGEEAYNSGTYEKASKLFDEITTTKDFVEFLTLPAYNML